MSIRRFVLKVPLGSAVALLALGAGVAQAEVPKLVSYGTFSTADSDFPAGEALIAADTVDQSSGDVYVADFANREFSAFGHVDKFSGGGALLSPPPPFAEGLDASAAINPTSGDLYVLEGLNFGTGQPEIATYDPSTGKPVGSHLPVAASGNFQGLTDVQIAANSEGDVYLPVAPENEVLEYRYNSTTNELEGPPAKTFTGEGTLKEPTGVAIDSSGNLWVADAGDSRIVELNDKDEQVTEIPSQGVESVALDGHGDVFAIVSNGNECGSLATPCPHLVEYTSTGVQVADVGGGSFGVKELQTPSTVAVDESSGRVYVADGLKGVVWVFGPPTAPIVGRELTSEVTTSEAKLGALVSPGGAETSYRFEYGTTLGYGETTPAVEGSAGEGVTARAVWAAASGLAPGTTYHYRVVATNELEPHGVYGPDQTFTTQTAEQAACSNEELRRGFSSRLPDCRAYELVIAPAKNSSQPWGLGPAAADGNAFGLETAEPLPGAPTAGEHYVFTREAGGWSPEDIIPLESYSGILCPGQAGGVVADSDELSSAVVAYGNETRASQGNSNASECNGEGLQVVSGEPVGYRNLLVRDNETGTYRLVNTPPPGVTPADANFQGASADLSHVVFTEESPLATGASYGVENLYEWDQGVVRLLTWLPNGMPTTGSLVAISAEGSHILFSSGGALYDRIDGEHTIQVDEKQAGASGSSGGGVFQTASADGSKVFFLDESKLTPESTAEFGKPDLYECEIVETGGEPACRTSDLTSETELANAGEHADVLHVSALGSADSSHVYFTAEGVLASNKREYQYTDVEGTSHTASEEATSGENNLYVDDGGAIKFVATLETNDYGGGAVSPDGTWFAFVSRKSLTGYDNSQSGGGPAKEIFLYNAASGGLVCASCDPSGEAPSAGGAELRSLSGRPLADGGRVFFETAEALVPSDTNGRIDVYEYEDGQPSLISSGTSANESTFEGASESGGDVFFESTQALVPQDTQEEEHVVYDARVDDGFPAIPSPPACTTADACRTPVSPLPSLYGAPSSQTFSGAGNLAAPVGKLAVKPGSLTRKQKLSRALRSCRERYGHLKKRRVACERKARKTYGSVKKAAGKAKSHKGGK